MAETRRKKAHVLLCTESKTGPKIELFPAEQWPEKGGIPGRFRVRVDGKWINGPKKEAFFNLAAIGEFMCRELAGALGIATPKPAPKPDLPRGTSVRAPNGKVLAGQVIYDRTHTSTDPILAMDGRWYVAVTIYGRGAFFVPVDELGQ